MLSSELRNQVTLFIESRITLEELETWFVPRLPIYLSIPNSADADVIAAIELGLAEVDNNLRSEAEVRSLLAEVLNQQQTIINYLENSITTGTTSNQTRLWLRQSALPGEATVSLSPIQL
jgi:hypothetical protein